MCSSRILYLTPLHFFDRIPPCAPTARSGGWAREFRASCPFSYSYGVPYETVRGDELLKAAGTTHSGQRSTSGDITAILTMSGQRPTAQGTSNAAKA